MAAWHLSPALVQLRSEINAAHPGRSKVMDGSIGDASHQARPSDHNRSRVDGSVNAIDVTNQDTGTPDRVYADDVAEQVAEHLRRTRDPRVKYVIWRGRMFSSYATATRKAWEWGPYRGSSNMHMGHVHVSVVFALRNSVKSWGYGAKRPVVKAVAAKVIAAPVRKAVAKVTATYSAKVSGDTQRALRIHPVDNKWGDGTDRVLNLVRSAINGAFPAGVDTLQRIIGAEVDNDFGPASGAALGRTIQKLQLAWGIPAKRADGAWGKETQAAYEKARKRNYKTW